ncbi:hypothetical protein I6G25_11530 (plasmid) [Macrococcoides caseolyticum]|uniref:hypothetical protein n=1 Tax=Macrococcoides caseolyticum TaxID=69966 RepID=UPI000CD22651|nr:hypothetical protein [Macrococcus caseolyticus]PNZ70934.1 hypothetical protein CD152_10595 [Macrococcus caseolyticus]QPT47840.1 hypothetical protein I6G25_11530 [Macrococcus caseolyticus]
MFELQATESIEKPNLTEFQQEFVQRLLKQKLNIAVEKGKSHFVLFSTTSLNIENTVTWDFGRGFFADGYLNENTKRFGESLRSKPIYVPNLIAILRHDLEPLGYKVIWKDTWIYNIGEITVSWEVFNES